MKDECASPKIAEALLEKSLGVHGKGSAWIETTKIRNRKAAVVGVDIVEKVIVSSNESAGLA